MSKSIRELSRYWDLKANWNSLFSQQNKNAVLDGWRAIAMLSVFCFHLFFTLREVVPFVDYQAFYHATPWMLYWVWSGDRGVDIFFVLSGFLVGYALLHEQDSTGTIDLFRFWVRRILRLVPVYYVLLIVYGVCGAPNAAAIWANFAFVNNAMPYEKTAMVWSWSLAVEMQFYLMLPLFIVGVLNRISISLRGQAMIIILVLMVSVRGLVLLADERLLSADAWRFFLDREFFKYFFSHFYDNFEVRVASLWLGVIAAFVYLFYPARLSALFRRDYGLLLVLASLLIIAVLMMLPGFVYRFEFSEYRASQVTYLFLHRYVFSAAIVVVLLFSLTGQGVIFTLINRLLRSQIWAPVARLSYSMYLVHIVVIYGVMNFGVDESKAEAVRSADYMGFNFPQLALGCLSLSLFISVILYLFIERPFMRIRA